jgi:hypothetical protein
VHANARPVAKLAGTNEDVGSRARNYVNAIVECGISGKIAHVLHVKHGKNASWKPRQDVAILMGIADYAGVLPLQGARQPGEMFAAWFVPGSIEPEEQV